MSIGKVKFEKGAMIWVILFTVCFGAIGWYGVRFAVKYFNYKTLSYPISSKVHTWGIERLAEDKYVVYARYSYDYSGQMYQGATTFRRTVFPNEVAAKSRLDQWKSYEWLSYVDTKKPEKSTLQRNFPVKLMIHLLIALGITGYFIYLYQYIQGFKSVI